MLAALPKHKGTEKLQADIRRKLSEARREPQRKGSTHAGAPPWLVRKEGAGQAALVGPPNSGKSQLVCALTRARPEVGAYPFTTHMPAAGMMTFEDVQIQLLDLPAIAPEFTEPWMPQVLRNANISILVVDPNDPDVLGETEFVLRTLESWHVARPSVLLGNKVDVPGAAANFSAVCEFFGEPFECVAASAATGDGLDAFRSACFGSLNVVRFYSKPPGRKADMGAPFVLRKGETVADAAAHVHREIAEHLRFARLYRSADTHGIMVERTHAVEDGDILEFHV
jgi:ribosome-interacting GTPase 1